MPINIYEKGKQARINGLTLESNPYQNGSRERRLWYFGWCEGNLLEFVSEQSQMISQQFKYGF